MADAGHDSNGTHHVLPKRAAKPSALAPWIPFSQKVVAEMLATYFLIFAGCGSIVVNLSREKVVTLPGIAITWGLAVMVVVYSVGHVSGAHFNPAVTIAFATCKRHPWKQVPAYVAAQVVGATLAAGTLRLLFEGKEYHFIGTTPSGSDLQAFVIEFIITFYLMFVVCAVATDSRAIGELAGLAIGAAVVSVVMAGPVSGGSMNPARSLGPAIVSGRYEGLWIYLLAPTLGAIGGAWAYNIIRLVSGGSMNPARSLVLAIVSGRYEGLWILAPTLGVIAGAWAYNIIRFTDRPFAKLSKKDLS